MTHRSSRLSGFYRLNIDDRLQTLKRFAELDDRDIELLRKTDALPMASADRMIENVAGIFSLPVGFAPNFRVDGRDVIVPLVVEEPSVVAACSNAAKLLRSGSGIETDTTEPIMIGQIQICELPDPESAKAAIVHAAPRLLEKANATNPRLVERGGGARRIETRIFPHTAVGPMLVVHLYADVRDAMGANLINTMVESIAAECHELTGGDICLRILSNLADERLVRAVGRVPLAMLERLDLGLDGTTVADRVVKASVFAEIDPYRAATHNKGIMNGIDSFLIATGQDWRAVEAGAHAFAARAGRYTALATWRREGDNLVGRIAVPMQVGTVGGVVHVHPTVGVLLKIAGTRNADELGRLATAVGLAQNLAAILALATEGIQRGHMSLHARNIAASVGAKEEQIDAVVAEMIKRRAINRETAANLFGQLYPTTPLT
ncbi:MAG: hydroxymethylglutaryl-CoA reductase, degradative [Myxococcales bacterium]|nr:hydroxymethylglutaryl-CoA reductase, degradative [Myxococcales bacterium]